MKIIITAFFGTLTFLLSISIYTLSFTDIDGNLQSMNAYQAKKILFVNIATNSNLVGQLAKLQQLQQQYDSNLVVIGFPSNSFDSEPKTNEQIKQFCFQNYGVTFKLAQKNNVTLNNQQPIYNWLTHQSQNGMMSQLVIGDFTKYLVDEEGLLIGVFAPKVDPFENEIIEAITQ